MGDVSRKYSRPRARVVLLLKGMAMGVADVIPGISGGTIAFMTGIYEDFIDAIRSVNLTTLRLLGQGRFSALRQQVEWLFLLILLSGIGISIISLSSLVKWLLQHEPVLLNAFFFGLIAASVPVIIGHLRQRHTIHYLAMFAATVAMYGLVGLVPVQTPESLPFIFVSGAIAICAMILPGISGSFILLLLGKYTFIITAISDRNFGILAVFMAGCVVGILSFVRLVHWLFVRSHDLTVAILAGLVLGSLRKIWPWKEVLETMVNRHGNIVPVAEANIWPPAVDVRFFGALGLVALGFGLAIALGRSGAEARPVTHDI